MPGRAPAVSPADRPVVRAFEDAGAVSPAAARPLAEIAGADPAAIVPLAARGVVREAEPGRYYLHAGTTHARRRAVVTAAVVAVLALIPALLIQLVGR